MISYCPLIQPSILGGVSYCFPRAVAKGLLPSHSAALLVA